MKNDTTCAEKIHVRRFIGNSREGSAEMLLILRESESAMYCAAVSYVAHPKSGGEYATKFMPSPYIFLCATSTSRSFISR